MSEKKDLTVLSKNLPEKERQALMAYLNTGGGQLNSAAAAQFYELFLRGSSCEEIQRLNKAFPLGAIIQARLEFNWDEKKAAYMEELQEKAKLAVMRSQLETAEYLSNMLSVIAKRDNDKLKKYLQTGNKEDLGDAEKNMLSVGRAIENLLKVTGQDKTVKINKKEELSLSIKGDGSLSDISSEGAANILSIIAEEKRKK